MRRWFWLLLLLGCGLSGCRSASLPPTVRGPRAASASQLPTHPPSPPPSVPLRLTDITAAAGIRFQHHTGAFGRKWFPETNGSGAAIFDYNGDGFPDLFLVNARDWSPEERRAAGVPPPAKLVSTPSRLFRNRGDGTFEDVTHGSGLDVPMYGMGCAVGDYDNDGDLDLYVTGVGRSRLFRNDAGRFTDVSVAAGVRGDGWASSCAWVDVNRDGRLDLFVCHYVDWRAREDLPCDGANDAPVYCGPNLYPPEPCRLYLQKSGGIFIDVSKAAGIWGSAKRPLTSKALGVALCDFNGDQWPDLAVANDTEANFLFRNNRNGTFTEEGTARGIALPESGIARSGMGIDSGDWDGSGRESLLIGNFAEEMLSLLGPSSGGLFADMAKQVGVGEPSLPFTTFGCLFVDLDNDGWLDIAAANGHIDSRMEKGNAVPLRQRPLFLLNHSGHQFKERVLLERALVGRGLAAGDIDLDGDVDLLLTTNGGSPVLLRNEQSGNRSLRLVLEGVTSNRSAIGAEIIARAGDKICRRVKSGSSYLSASELPVTVGLGKAMSAVVSILWPSGVRQSVGTLSAGNTYYIREKAGITRTLPLREGAK